MLDDESGLFQTSDSYAEAPFIGATVMYISSNECKIGILNVISYIKRQHYVICSIQSFKSAVGEVKEYILFIFIPPMITQLCDMIPPKSIQGMETLHMLKLRKW